MPLIILRDRCHVSLKMQIHFIHCRLFATVNKSTLLLGDAVNKISQGSKSSISSDEILQRLEDLSTIVPEWIVMVNSGTVKTLRLNRSTTLQAAKDRISETLKIV